MNWFKKWFAKPAPPVREMTEIERLEAENIELGRQADEIRARRRELKQRADALRDGRN